MQNEGGTFLKGFGSIYIRPRCKSDSFWFFFLFIEVKTHTKTGFFMKLKKSGAAEKWLIKLILFFVEIKYMELELKNSSVKNSFAIIKKLINFFSEILNSSKVFFYHRKKLIMFFR